MMKNKNTIIFRAITTCLLVAVFVTSIPCLEEAHALAPWAGTQSFAVQREAVLRLTGRFRIAKSTDDIRELGGKHDTLDNSGIVLVSKSVAANDLLLLRTIINREIKTLMQVMAGSADTDQYETIKEAVLESLPPEHNPDPNAYVNHTIAKAFEILILLEEGLISEEEITEEERTFIRKIRPTINAYRDTYFTGIFWDWDVRERRIRHAIANGEELGGTESGTEEYSPGATVEKEVPELEKPQAEIVKKISKRIWLNAGYIDKLAREIGQKIETEANQGGQDISFKVAVVGSARYLADDNGWIPLDLCSDFDIFINVRHTDKDTRFKYYREFKDRLGDEILRLSIGKARNVIKVGDKVLYVHSFLAEQNGENDLIWYIRATTLGKPMDGLSEFPHLTHRYIEELQEHNISHIRMILKKYIQAELYLGNYQEYRKYRDRFLSTNTGSFEELKQLLKEVFEEGRCAFLVEQKKKGDDFIEERLAGVHFHPVGELPSEGPTVLPEADPARKEKIDPNSYLTMIGSPGMIIGLVIAAVVAPLLLVIGIKRFLKKHSKKRLERFIESRSGKELRTEIANIRGAIRDAKTTRDYSAVKALLLGIINSRVLAANKFKKNIIIEVLMSQCPNLNNQTIISFFNIHGAKKLKLKPNKKVVIKRKPSVASKKTKRPVPTRTQKTASESSIKIPSDVRYSKTENTLHITLLGNGCEGIFVIVDLKMNTCTIYSDRNRSRALPPDDPKRATVKKLVDELVKRFEQKNPTFGTNTVGAAEQPKNWKDKSDEETTRTAKRAKFIFEQAKRVMKEAGREEVTEEDVATFLNYLRSNEEGYSYAELVTRIKELFITQDAKADPYNKVPYLRLLIEAAKTTDEYELPTFNSASIVDELLGIMALDDFPIESITLNGLFEYIKDKKLDVLKAGRTDDEKMAILCLAFVRKEHERNCKKALAGSRLGLLRVARAQSLINGARSRLSELEGVILPSVRRTAFVLADSSVEKINNRKLSDERYDELFSAIFKPVIDGPQRKFIAKWEKDYFIMLSRMSASELQEEWNRISLLRDNKKSTPLYYVTVNDFMQDAASSSHPAYLGFVTETDWDRSYSENEKNRIILATAKMNIYFNWLLRHLDPNSSRDLQAIYPEDDYSLDYIMENLSCLRKRPREAFNKHVTYRALTETTDDDAFSILGLRGPYGDQPNDGGGIFVAVEIDPGDNKEPIDFITDGIQDTSRKVGMDGGIDGQTPVQKIREEVRKMSSQLEPYIERVEQIAGALSPEKPLHESTKKKLEDLISMVEAANENVLIVICERLNEESQKTTNKNLSILLEGIKAAFRHLIGNALGGILVTASTANELDGLSKDYITIIKEGISRMHEDFLTLNNITEVRLDLSKKQCSISVGYDQDDVKSKYPFIMHSFSEDPVLDTAPADNPALSSEPGKYVHSMSKTRELTATLNFNESVLALREDSKEAITSQAVKLESTITEYADRSKQSIVLYADDILKSAAVMDLEDTVKNILSKHKVLNGGKIFLYDRDEKGANAKTIEAIIKRADPKIEVVTTTKKELRNTKGTELNEIEALNSLVAKKSGGKTLAFIRGPLRRRITQEEINDIAQFARDNEVPIIIVGSEKKAVYSFAQALDAAIRIKTQVGPNGTIAMLLPIKIYSEEIEVERLRSFYTRVSA